MEQDKCGAGHILECLAPPVAFSDLNMTGFCFQPVKICVILTIKPSPISEFKSDIVRLGAGVCISGHLACLLQNKEQLTRVVCDRRPDDVVQFQQAHAGVNKKSSEGGSPMMDLLEGRPQPKFYTAVTTTDSDSA